MSTVPEKPKLFHITHVDNLASIIVDDALCSEAALLSRGGPMAAVGMGHIKRHRFTIAVPCHPGTKVADYVPFYFCPRSVMLFILHKGNHPDVDYRGGQEPILHLEFDLHEVVAWADANGHSWAFTPMNAAAAYTPFYAEQRALVAIDWQAVATNEWRSADVQEHKQAEFLVHESVPWSLVRRIAVYGNAIHDKVLSIIAPALISLVEVRREWYY